MYFPVLHHPCLFTALLVVVEGEGNAIVSVSDSLHIWVIRIKFVDGCRLLPRTYFRFSKSSVPSIASCNLYVLAEVEYAVHPSNVVHCRIFLSLSIVTRKNWTWKVYAQATLSLPIIIKLQFINMKVRHRNFIAWADFYKRFSKGKTIFDTRVVDTQMYGLPQCSISL